MTDNLKVTKKDNFNSIINILNTLPSSDATDSLKAFCQTEIDTLDKKSAKAKAKRQSKPGADADALTDAVKAVLTNEFATIADITAALDNADATAAKVGYRLRTLEASGFAEKAQVTIPGTDGTKARKVVAYKKV